MSQRTSAARKGRSAIEITLGGLAGAIEALSKRVRSLEQNRNQLAAGLRFDIEYDGDDAYLVVERVTTGNRERIAGPL